MVIPLWYGVKFQRIDARIDACHFTISENDRGMKEILCFYFDASSNKTQFYLDTRQLSPTFHQNCN